jgi:hypothetical protein
LKLKFGTWEIEWGTINRFQRPNGDINYNIMMQKVYPCIWTSDREVYQKQSSYQNGSKKRYGSNGNSFVCAVEFNKSKKANSYLWEIVVIHNRNIL